MAPLHLRLQNYLKLAAGSLASHTLHSVDGLPPGPMCHHFDHDLHPEPDEDLQ